MPRIYKQTSHWRFRKCQGFRYKLVIWDSKIATELHRNKALKIQKLQWIFVKTSHLRFKRCKVLRYKLVNEDSKGAKDLYTN